MCFLTHSGISVGKCSTGPACSAKVLIQSFIFFFTKKPFCKAPRGTGMLPFSNRRTKAGLSKDNGGLIRTKQRFGGKTKRRAGWESLSCRTAELILICDTEMGKTDKHPQLMRTQPPPISYAALSERFETRQQERNGCKETQRNYWVKGDYYLRRRKQTCTSKRLQQVLHSKTDCLPLPLTSLAGKKQITRHAREDNAKWTTAAANERRQPDPNVATCLRLTGKNGSSPLPRLMRVWRKSALCESLSNILSIQPHPPTARNRRVWPCRRVAHAIQLFHTDTELTKTKTPTFAPATTENGIM